MYRVCWEDYQEISFDEYSFLDVVDDGLVAELVLVLPAELDNLLLTHPHQGNLTVIHLFIHPFIHSSNCVVFNHLLHFQITKSKIIEYFVDNPRKHRISIRKFVCDVGSFFFMYTVQHKMIVEYSRESKGKNMSKRCKK